MTKTRGVKIDFDQKSMEKHREVVAERYAHTLNDIRGAIADVAAHMGMEPIDPLMISAIETNLAALRAAAAVIGQAGTSLMVDALTPKKSTKSAKPSRQAPVHTEGYA